MKSLVARIERLEEHVAAVASEPVYFEKRPFTEEDEAEMLRIFCELTADARARNPNYDEELARLSEGLLVGDEDAMNER